MTLSKPTAETRTTRMRDREFSDENWSKLMADAKQEAIEFLVNRRFITEAEASQLAELSLEEIRGIYDGHALSELPDGEDGADPPHTADDEVDLEDYEAGPDPESDDDPYCVCGVARSEHTLCGCAEGFQSAESWKEEREAIRQSVFDDMYNDRDFDEDAEYYPDDRYDDDPEYYYHPNEY